MVFLDRAAQSRSPGRDKGTVRVRYCMSGGGIRQVLASESNKERETDGLERSRDRRGISKMKRCCWSRCVEVDYGPG